MLLKNNNRVLLNDLPVVASKYQILIKGKDNFEKMWKWATTGNRSDAEHWLQSSTKPKLGTQTTNLMASGMANF